MPSATHPQEYWLPGYGLSRHIIFRELRCFLGPEATVRPYSYHGREGYLINGTPLTKEQIEDLRQQSREYEKQQTIRMSSRAVATTASSEPDINEPVIVTVARRTSPAYSSTSYSPYRRHRWSEFTLLRIGTRGDGLQRVGSSLEMTDQHPPVHGSYRRQ